MIRSLLLAVAGLALAGIVLWQGQREPPPPGGCEGVREAHERVVELETARRVPTADRYASGRTPAIERQEARVDAATTRVEAWLRDSCGA